MYRLKALGTEESNFHSQHESWSPCFFDYPTYSTLT
ncbi:hypothetical protein GGP79_001137 [Salinibacter ruber]|nr:hypothetical protein [Salinibacter ruber]